MRLTRTTAPDDYPVEWETAKDHLNLNDETERNYVEHLIEAATGIAETVTNRALMTQTWTLYQDAVPPGSELILPYPPLQSVTSIKYKDVDGNEQTFSAAEYDVDTVSEPGRIALVESTSGWPSVQSSTINVFYVEYDAGYTSIDKVPSEIKHAILMMVAHLYEHREDVADVGHGLINVLRIPQGSEWLLFPYRVQIIG